MRRLLSLLLVFPAAAFAVEPEQAELRITTSPPGAAITLDGVLVGISPRTERVAAGVHTLTAERSGAVSAQTLSVTAGEVRPVTLSLEALLAPPRPFPLKGTLTFGGGALALGLGLLLQEPARAAGRQVSLLYEKGGGWDGPAREVEAAGLRAQTWSWFFTGAGLAAMASGLVVTGLEWFGHRDLPLLVVLPQVGGGLLCWGGRW